MGVRISRPRGGRKASLNEGKTTPKNRRGGGPVFTDQKERKESTVRLGHVRRVGEQPENSKNHGIAGGRLSSKKGDFLIKLSQRLLIRFYGLCKCRNSEKGLKSREGQHKCFLGYCEGSWGNN